MTYTVKLSYYDEFHFDERDEALDFAELALKAGSLDEVKVVIKPEGAEEEEDDE